jgi:hypothetical protein
MGRLYQREKSYRVMQPQKPESSFKLPTLEGLKSAGVSFMASGERDDCDDPSLREFMDINPVRFEEAMINIRNTARKHSFF